MEQLKLDWYGDEEEVVLFAVQYPNNYLGELRIPKAKVDEYAKEAGRDENNPQAGARSFEIARLDPTVAKLRRRRMKHAPVDNILTTFAMSKAQAALAQIQGKVDMGNDHGDDVPSLQKKNQALQNEVKT